MHPIKKMLLKRKVKKNAAQMKKDVKKAYRNFAQDLQKTVRGTLDSGLSALKK